MYIEWLPERTDLEPPDDDISEETWDVFTDPDYLLELEWELENFPSNAERTTVGV